LLVILPGASHTFKASGVAKAWNIFSADALMIFEFRVDTLDPFSI
jgi:hypothetical protein